MPDKRFEHIGFNQAVETIEEIYEDMYGEDNIVVKKLGGKVEIRAKGVSDATTIDSVANGINLLLNVTQPDTAREIKNRLGQTNQSQAEVSESVERAEDEDEAVVNVDNTVTPRTAGDVVKPFTKEEADFKDPSDPGFDNTHDICRNCAFFDDHGNCRIVEDINPDGYCEEFFADLLVSAHDHGDTVETNLLIKGDNFEPSTFNIEDFHVEIRERLQQARREE